MVDLFTILKQTYAADALNADRAEKKSREYHYSQAVLTGYELQATGLHATR